MHPRIWGSDTWRSIHYIALGYPTGASPELQGVYASYFEVLGQVLPCVKCSKHYREHMDAYPIQPSLVGRMELFRWTVDLHNAVNTSIGRQPWSYEHAFQVYADRRTQEPGQVGVQAIVFSLSLLVIAGLVVWWKRRP